MRDLNDLYYFAKVVQAGSFSAAARALDIPKSRLSRRLALLEEQLQVRLLQRTTRKLRLTTAGERYLEYCRSIIDAAHAADDAIEQLRAEPAGTVVLSAPIAVAQQILPALLPVFLSQWPKVDLHVLTTNRRIDLIAEGVDVAIRVRARLDTDAELIVRRLGTGGSYLVASPAFLNRHGMPTHPLELADYPALAFSDTAGPQRWSLHGPRDEHANVTVQARLYANDFPLLVEAARQHHGIALLPDMAAAPAIRDGSLMHVLPQWRSDTGIIHLVYPSRRGMLPAAKAMIEFLAERLPAAYSVYPLAGTPR